MSSPSRIPPASNDPVRRPRNPFRNESDAFLLLIVVGVAVIAVALVASQVNAIIGAALGAVLLALGIRTTLRWIGAAVAARERGEDDNPYGEPWEH